MKGEGQLVKHGEGTQLDVVTMKGDHASSHE